MLNKIVQPKDFTEGALTQALLGIARLGKKANIEITATSPEAMEFFKTLPETQQRSLHEQVSFYLKILKLGISEDRESLDLTLEEEKDLAQFALSELGLQLPDDFLDHVEQRDVIEIYNSDGIQLYRNFEFFKKCGYTLLDLISQEWFLLYERSSTITEAILSATKNCLLNGKGTVAYNLPTHILRERYLKSGSVFEMKMKFLSPLWREGTKERGGFIHSLSAIPISLGDETEKIGFI